MSLIETITSQSLQPSRRTPPVDDFMPAWTWEELELALLCLPLPLAQRLAVPSLVSATRMASPYQTPISTLKELVALVSGLGEDLEPARPGTRSGGGPAMT